VGPRAVLDAVVKRKIPSPRRESNPRTPMVQPIAEDKSQTAVYKLSQTVEKNNVKNSSKKTKANAFSRNEPTTAKITVDGKTIEQISRFEYFGCEISYRNNRNMEDNPGS
jgi:hypothetical protein